MNTIARLHWPLILGLGAVALIRPLVQVVASGLGVDPPAAVSIVLTILISAAWIGVVGLTRVRRPVLTLIFAALAYAVFSIALSAVASPIINGELQGPLTMPVSIIAMMITNAIWGAITGVIALGLQRARGFRPEPAAR